MTRRLLTAILFVSSLKYSFIIYLVFIVEAFNIFITAYSKLYRNVISAVLDILLILMAVAVKSTIGVLVLVGAICLYSIGLVV